MKERGSGSQRRPDTSKAGRGQRRAKEDGAQRDIAPRTGSRRLAPTRKRAPEPAIAEGVTGRELDRSVHAQLRTLSKENAEGVAQHLVMAATLLDVDIDGALAHAETAVRRAGRVPAAREALGLVAYRVGDFARALAEFRTARRLSGSAHLLPLIVDCERALGRPMHALEIASTPETQRLTTDERVELAIVVSGIRRDAGQPEAAAAGLEIPELGARPRQPWSARLRYAYAESQLALGNRDLARQWFARAVEADEECTTDAAERLEELDGIAYTDLLPENEADLEAVLESAVGRGD